MSVVVVQVYPRVCGGTSIGRELATVGEGLSPRLRGNPFSEARLQDPPGSIPARAGEPPCVSGTLSSKGLSPRVRGNPICDNLSHIV